MHLFYTLDDMKFVKLNIYFISHKFFFWNMLHHQVFFYVSILLKEVFWFYFYFVCPCVFFFIVSCYHMTAAKTQTTPSYSERCRLSSVFLLLMRLIPSVKEIVVSQLAAAVFRTHVHPPSENCSNLDSFKTGAVTQNPMIFSLEFYLTLVFRQTWTPQHLLLCNFCYFQ